MSVVDNLARKNAERGTGRGFAGGVRMMRIMGRPMWHYGAILVWLVLANLAVDFVWTGLGLAMALAAGFVWAETFNERG